MRFISIGLVSWVVVGCGVQGPNGVYFEEVPGVITPVSGGTSGGGSGGTGTGSGESGAGGSAGSGGVASGGSATGGSASGGSASGGSASGGSASGGTSGGSSGGDDTSCAPGYGLDVSGHCALEPVPTGACAFVPNGAAEPGALVMHGRPAAAALRFDVFTESELGSISPYLYGTTAPIDMVKNRQTILRAGGSRVTAYNWENNASNGGRDWYYQNDASMGWSNVPAAGLAPFVQVAEEHGAAAILTLPLADYVSADKLGDGDVRNSGPDYLTTRFKQNIPLKGAPLSSVPDTTDTFVYQDEFVSHMKATQPSTELMFALDNEPELWAEIHPEVHPDPLTYVELAQRNVDFAKSVKTVWPEAKVLGFGSYGWLGYITLQNAPDAGAHGDFIEYYLGQMAAAETAFGSRLIDYLDLHWYPEAQGGGKRVVFSGSNEPEVVAARLQAPRSLWDTGYTEVSWITSVWPEPLRLLPRLQAKIDSRYPGTKLAFTEWNYGGSGVISGAISSADVLGIFGCYGVGIATEWGLEADESYFYAALRAYTNYDGEGARFGDTSLRAGTSNYETSSVYASRDTAGNVVVMALNKLPDPQTTALVFHSQSALTQAKVFTITEASSEIQPGAQLVPTAVNSFSYEMPANSVSILVFSG